MASTISDFSNQIKKMHPDIGIISNYIEEPDYNQGGSNPYKRQVTLDNTGKTAKSNYLVAFTLDTQTIYRNNDCAWTFSDLRVYDSDEVTELSFYVEAPNTTYTTIYVKVPSISANSSKNIFLYYGNPGLKNKASLAATCGNVFVKSTLAGWWKSNEVSRSRGGGLTDSELVYMWENKANRQQNAIQSDSTKRPVFRTNIVNNQPVVWAGLSGPATGDETMNSDPIQPFKLKSTSEISIFGVCYANVTKQRYQRQFSMQTGSNYVINHHWNGTAADTRFILGNDGGVGGGLANGLVIDTWNLSACHWKQNTFNGMQTFRNNALVAQRTSVNVGLGNELLYLFSYLGSSEFFSGYSGDIIVFSDFLTTSERNEVAAYMNAKFRIYSTSDMPTITVGSQQNVTQVRHQYTSFAPFSKFSSNSEIENKLYGTASNRGKATIQNLFNKVLASGSPFENWSNSNSDSISSLSNMNCRSATASTSVQVDSVNIERLDGSNNINDLSKFEFNNIIDSSTVYLSLSSDWIEFDFMCENVANLDLAGSYIRFENSGGTLSYQSAFNKNQNTIVSNKLSIIKILKSEFTKTGSGDWSDCTILKVGRKTTSGSQNVKYGNFQLKKNFGLDADIDVLRPIRLQNSVSSDQDLTYYSQPVIEGRITNKLVSSYDTSLSVADYLEVVKNKTFGELDSFPSGFVCFVGDDSGIGFGYKRTYHSYFMRKLLGFIFQKSYLDIDLDFLAGTDTTGLFGSLLLTDQFIPNLNFFVVLATDKIGEVIDRLLNPTFGYLTYDSVSNKMIARNGYKTWDKDYIPAAHDIDSSIIYEYKEESQSDEIVYNYLNLQLYKDIQENGTIVGFGDGGYELQPNASTTIFFDEEMIIPGTAEVYPMGNFRVDGWSAAANAQSTAFDGTNLSITSVGAIGQKIYIEIYNANSTKRYLRQLNLTADYVKFIKNNTFYSVLQNVQAGELFDFEIKDQTSITKLGKNKFELNNLYTYGGIDSFAAAKFPLLYYRFIDRFKERTQLLGISSQYQPQLRCGQIVKVRNKEGRVITGHVLKHEVYSEGEEYTNTSIVREIKQ